MYVEKRMISLLLVMVLMFGVLLGSRMEIRQPMEKEPEESWSSIKETIYVWYSDEALSGYIGTAAVNFGEAEGVRVIPVLQSADRFLEEVNDAAMDPEKQMPDAYVINNDELEKAYLAGLATQILDPNGVVSEKNLPGTALSAVTYNGRKVAYPFYFDTSVLVYNKDYLRMWVEQQEERAAQGEELPPEDGEYFSENGGIGNPEEGEVVAEDIPLESIIRTDGLPLTVDGILHFADTIDVPDGVDGVMKWDVSDIFYNYWIVGAYLKVGGDNGDDYNNIHIYNDEVISCLEVYQALNQFFYIESDKVNYESAVQDFVDGKIVFTIGSTDILQRLETAKEEGSFAFDFGLATLPQVSTQLGSRTLSVTNAVAINGYSRHKDLANRFAEYLTRDFAEELYGRSGKVSVFASVDWGDEMLKVFHAQYKESVSLPKMMEIGNLWLMLEALFSKVWNGEEVLPLVQELENQVSTQILLE